jgi:hypothetical protein
MGANAPARLNIRINKGGAFSKRIAVVNADGTARNLTGYSAKMQIRQDVDDVVAALTLAPAVVGPSGYVDITITKVQTAALTIQSGVWDLWIDNGGSDSPEYLVEGGVEVKKMVTQ